MPVVKEPATQLDGVFPAAHAIKGDPIVVRTQLSKLMIGLHDEVGL